MAKTIAQRELRNDNAKVIDAVQAGQTFIVTRNGVPVAEIRPFRGATRRFVPKADVLDVFGSGPHIDFDEFRADMDRRINQDL